MKELIELVEARHAAIHVPHAVATVLRVEGSSYRRPGARMLVDVHGRVAGSVSGGCLEKKVISEARATLLDGKARHLSFDTTDQDDLAFGSSLGCQGKIWIGIESLAAHQPWALEAVVRETRKRRKPAALITQIRHDKAMVVFESAVVFNLSQTGESLVVPPAWRDELEDIFLVRKTRFIGEDLGHSALVEWLTPPLVLLLFGGGPDVPPMVKLAKELGHEITVIDRRPAFAVPEQFPGANRVLALQPHQLASLLPIDEGTAAVLMNHHYDTDRDVLAALLPLGLRYIAMLGPRRRTERILAELEERGFDLSQDNRGSIHGPAGLDLGAETPEQIALSILAEVQATLAGRTGDKLKYRAGPIHVDIAVKENGRCPVPA